jgi:hypothetical protein
MTMPKGFKSKDSKEEKTVKYLTPTADSSPPSIYDIQRENLLGHMQRETNWWKRRQLQKEIEKLDKQQLAVQQPRAQIMQSPSIVRIVVMQKHHIPKN